MRCHDIVVSHVPRDFTTEEQLYLVKGEISNTHSLLYFRMWIEYGNFLLPSPLII